ncbi:hypothetical protein TNIN_45471 [Trichonephila inaurata madagascariensis]|uniref:Uncharacterized protein n=1 Tax=Trichonephila inaurata madagascariensis TaxID=2747483 RepID=A0A8X7BSF1_9ARAC|nr:hypothetical protein TNIN_45471 [Trichonephila inaurata madagascariensis]
MNYERCSPQLIAEAVIHWNMPVKGNTKLGQIPADYKNLKSLDLILSAVYIVRYILQDDLNSLVKKLFKFIHDIPQSKYDFLRFIRPRCLILSNENDCSNMMITCAFLAHVLAIVYKNFKCYHFTKTSSKFLTALLNKRFNETFENDVYWEKLITFSKIIHHLAYQANKQEEINYNFLCDDEYDAKSEQTMKSTDSSSDDYETVELANISTLIENDLKLSNSDTEEDTYLSEHSFDTASLENHASESICSDYDFGLTNLSILESDLALSSSDEDREFHKKYDFMENTNKKKLEIRVSGSFSSDDNLSEVNKDSDFLHTDVRNMTRNESALSSSGVNGNELYSETEYCSQNMKEDTKNFELHHDLPNINSNNKCEILSKKRKYPFESDKGNSGRNSKKANRDQIANIKFLFEDKLDLLIKCENPMNVEDIILEGYNTSEDDDEIKDTIIDRTEKNNSSEIECIPLKMTISSTDEFTSRIMVNEYSDNLNDNELHIDDKSSNVCEFCFGKENNFMFNWLKNILKDNENLALVSDVFGSIVECP